MTALRILYLEDNADHVFLVSDVLQLHFPGTHVEHISHFTEALACLGGRNYDAILTCTAIQGESVIPRLQDIVAVATSSPIIVIAGSGDEKSAANAIKHGATDYLVKSRESLEVLPYLIQKLLKRRKPQSESSPQPLHGNANLDHLLQEIDHVSRRVHTLQGTSPADTILAGLRDEIYQLKQLAMQLSEYRKTGKS